MVDVANLDDLTDEERAEREARIVKDTEIRQRCLDKFNGIRKIKFTDRTQNDVFWFEGFAFSPHRMSRSNQDYTLEEKLHIYRTAYEDLVENLNDYVTTYVNEGMGGATEFMNELTHLTKSIEGILDKVRETVLEISRRENGDWF